MEIGLILFNIFKYFVHAVSEERAILILHAFKAYLYSVNFR